MTDGGGPTLFCTDTVARRFADRISAAARIELAFFSADAFPERSTHFMGVAIRAPRLRWLHTFSAGTDHPVFATLRERGVRVTTSSGAAAAPIARTVVLYLLALSRDLPRLLRDQAAHRWDPRPFRDLDGAVIGVVGMGPIGREVIRLTTALGMRPIGVRRAVAGDEPCETWTLDRVAELAAAVDVLVVALPLTEETRGIVSADVIARLRPGALFVNIGRGELVDELALKLRSSTGESAAPGWTCSRPSRCPATARCGTSRT